MTLAMSDLVRELRLGRSTLCRMISSGDFPPADVAIGAKIRLWKRATVVAWIEQAAGNGERSVNKLPNGARAGAN